MSGGDYTALDKLESQDLPGRSSLASAGSDGWLNLSSLKKSKPVVVALGVITLVTVFVGTQFTIGEGGFDYRSAGKYGVVPEEVLAGGRWEGAGFSKQWGNLSDVLQFVMGPPANSIRENLKPDLKYVTGWNGAGMTNVIMSYINVIYLGMISDRVVIIPPITPTSQVSVKGAEHDTPPLNFGDIFDLPRLRKEINWPVLDWADVKKAAYGVEFSPNTTPQPGVKLDELGCWGIRTIGNTGSKEVKRPIHEWFLQLDCSYTVLPPDALIRPDNYHVKVWSMAAATFPQGRKRILDNPRDSPSFPTRYGSQSVIPPDEHLAVFDDTYGVSANVPYEWFEDFSPVWRFVGRHIHFTEKFEKVADEYTRKMFGLGENDAIPLYILIHIRRGDWAQSCEHNHPELQCAAPLSVFAARAEEVQRGLIEKYGPESPQANVTHIIVTSDEKDPKWWQTITDQGWYFIDHDKEETGLKYSGWHPAVIDKVIQSRAIGLVGVRGSTMSMIAERRVQDWNGGIVTEVNWRNGQGARRRSINDDEEDWVFDE